MKLDSTYQGTLANRKLRGKRLSNECKQGDVVLVSLRDFQDEKADIIIKYSFEEASDLKRYGELPNSVKVCVADTVDDAPTDGELEFDSDVSVDIDDI